ncbi:MAG TPA: D-alanyl-D-alanine carboxypeptidase/D-alanyl-D-alanine-endopeptidase [Methylophilaceae bacterium]|nr:D-alanyl-D-alanine carboxypeptidase/D-alanyl-D-alanine-endopeptidase [Methylophilaceae bacterium]HQR60933.1 D-alanyl-D-alanine carboxypeptidase/D-alanyl-D-alanine-endopeptidase [Methylophilaceae bacterium]
MKLLALLLAGWLAITPALANGLPAPVAKALKAAGVPQDGVAFYVQQVDQHQPRLSHRADQPMNPASTMKLLTTDAGLELLGPSYRWRTEIYGSVPPQDEVLNGDLIIKGYGDPALTLENFWLLLRMLRQSGVRDIRGDLLLDRGYFDTSGNEPPGKFDGETYRAYNAAPDAMLVNFKATRFTLRGDPALGKVLITADPALPQLNIVNQVALSQVPCADWKDRIGYRVLREKDVVTVTFSGNYSVACGEKALELSILDDDVYVFELFRRMWQEQGGQISGGLKNGSLPPGAQRLVQADSPPLADVIRLVNKYSNNVMARQILMTLGAERYGAPGSPQSGALAVREWLAGKGMEWPELAIENGAGLSRNERISARHLGELLLSAYRSPVMPELMSSLPIVAIDGTMQHRLKSSAVAGQAHLKTGSLDGVRAMAGYLLDARGRRWVVVFMANHPAAAGSKAAQDALLEYVYALP